MIDRASACKIFTLVSCIAYVMCFYEGWTLFYYYPAVAKLSFSALGPEMGPAMMWYGWMANAAVAGLVFAVVTPGKVADLLPSSLLWIVPFLALISVFAHEVRWFV